MSKWLSQILGATLGNDWARGGGGESFHHLSVWRNASTRQSVPSVSQKWSLNHTQSWSHFYQRQLNPQHQLSCSSGRVPGTLHSELRDIMEEEGKGNRFCRPKGHKTWDLEAGNLIVSISGWKITETMGMALNCKFNPETQESRAGESFWKCG